MALPQINFSCGSIINRCSDLLRYVYEIPNAFIGRISQAEPLRSLQCTSLVKPRMHHVLGIAVVGFVDDH